MRGSTKLLLALIAICAFALTATSAQAAKPQVKLLSKGQSGILANGSVKARVTLKVRKGRRAKVKVKVKVKGFSATFDRPPTVAATSSGTSVRSGWI
ncbi:MAG: hypothetical protein JJE23_04415, partial [Thermoleophilia bacterium]|nr:hypothetical protein [Thermoleophilia bacterium]